MTRMWTAVALVAFAYLVGSIASAIVVSRLMGLPDPRTGGSGNPGATNVLRLGGRKAAALTLAGDYLKGLVPVLVAVALGASPALRVATGLAAFLGHLYPLYFRFQGGKGVATALGLGTGLGWPLGLAMGATWLLVARLSRYSSLASLTMALLTPIYAAVLGAPPPVVTGLAAMSLLLVWRHRANIVRLATGCESRIGTKPAPGGETAPPE